MMDATSALAQQLATHYRTPSFRDLQRTTSFLHAKSEAADERARDFESEVRALREQSRRDAATLAALSQDMESQSAALREAEARAAAEGSRATEAENAAARLHERSGLAEAGLATAERREAWLLEELREARNAVAGARQECSDLRADSASLSTQLKVCAAERDELLAQLAATRSDLAATRSSLDAEGRALDDTRAEAAQLHAQCREAARALGAAREANQALASRAEHAEQEAQRMSLRTQQLSNDVWREAEARGKADRAAFALGEQKAALAEAHDALQRRRHADAKQQRATKQESAHAKAEARALAIRLGLYRSVLKSDVASIMGAA